MKKFQIENLSFNNSNCDDKYKWIECRSSDTITEYYFHIMNNNEKKDFFEFDKNLNYYHNEFINF